MEHIDKASMDIFGRAWDEAMGYRPEDVPPTPTKTSPDLSKLAQRVVQQTIRSECAAIADLLVKKNQDYGNSFADPVMIFSKSDPEEQINVRIDDKLKRLMNRGDKNISEDTEADLIGYLILKRVYRKIKAGRGE